MNTFEQHPHYWAPEVTYHNGQFYLYYSVGDEVTMQMRVAVASAARTGSIAFLLEWYRNRTT